ncbi:MAG: hypothetical protein AB7L65_05755 [Hyphomonadaceae bacterium]
MKSAVPALWIIAAGAITAGLYFFRESLSQFALALLLWLLIDGFAAWISARARFVPRYVALAIAIVIVLGVTGAVIFVLARNFGAFAANADLYGARIDD